MCGEKRTERKECLSDEGSPPRVRGEVDTLHGSKKVERITPACAGRSMRARSTMTATLDHPRVCGEKLRSLAVRNARTGSPPRVRGEVYVCSLISLTCRITPACAGRSRPLRLTRLSAQDHPRVCGEKLMTSCPGAPYTGSPPRVRGEVNDEAVRYWEMGITPACAGRRARREKTASILKDHPRVCGEKIRSSRAALTCSGSPPRVRGEGRPCGGLCSRGRITPACAGRRHRFSAPYAARRDHPRVCGEKRPKRMKGRLRKGSPPRVRGEAFVRYFGSQTAGITPACAGRSWTGRR